MTEQKMSAEEYAGRKLAIQEQLRNDMIDLEYKMALLMERGASALFDLETEYRGIQKPPVSTHTAPIPPLDSEAVEPYLGPLSRGYGAILEETRSLRDAALSVGCLGSPDGTHEWEAQTLYGDDAEVVAMRVECKLCHQEMKCHAP